MLFKSLPQKVAFVLGNSDYGDEADNLSNTVRDAKAVAAKLRELGFQVVEHFDLEKGVMEAAFRAFIGALKQKTEAKHTWRPTRPERKHVDTAVLYYAGHACQIDGKNYLLSVRDSSGAVGDVSLQRWIRELEDLADRRLIFLDACRNLDEEKVAESVARTRGAVENWKPDVKAGLADADYGSEIFLSFSAAPGKKAYDGIGDSPHSPYAEALLEHIGAVDLELSVIMGRVHEAVKARTMDAPKGVQETWSSFALSRAYFFRPNSLLFLAGNLMAFVALFVAVATMAVAFFAAGAAANASAAAAGMAESVFVILAGTLLAGLALGALVHGMGRAYNRLRGAPVDTARTWDAEGVGMASIAAEGAIGGMLGGIIGAPLLSLTYYWEWRFNSYHPDLAPGECASYRWFDPPANELCPNLARLTTEVSFACIFIATVLGFLALHFSLRVQKSRKKWLARFNEQGCLLIGAVLGGSLAGLVCGPIVTAYFGQFDRPFLRPTFVSAVSALGVSIVAFSIVNYSLERFSMDRLKRSVRAVTIATVVAGVVLAGLVGLLEMADFISNIFYWANAGYWDERKLLVYRYGYLMAGGLPYGLVFGACLGLLIGVTRILTEPLTGPRLRIKSLEAAAS